MNIEKRSDSSVAARPSWANLLALLGVPLFVASAGCVGDTNAGQDEPGIDHESSPLTLTQLTTTEKNLAFDSYNNAFYVANNVVSGTTDFASWNKYNDDVMWAVIALVRGYEITGNHTFLDQAQWQYNAVWSRAWDNQLGGGLWWTTDRTSKNACVNGPAAIAAMLLARNTVNTGYRSQADQIYNWLRGTLVNTSTGQVADHIDANGTKVWWAFTYNQGTFAGAAALLYQDTVNNAYRTDASLAVSWARSNLTGRSFLSPRAADVLRENSSGAGPAAGGLTSPKRLDFLLPTYQLVARKLRPLKPVKLWMSWGGKVSAWPVQSVVV